MSAISGIGISPELLDKFSAAVDSKDVRFLKISIRNESLVHDVSKPISGSLEDDLNLLQDILEDNVPAYVLVRLDDPPNEWLAVSYVPDAAKVRDKMLYASTRTTLMKSLGSALFTDSLFATSKSDVTPDGYRSHRMHLAAPQPLSTREKEMADIKAAEREAGGGSYEGSRTRQNHLGTGVGLKWTEDVREAVKDLGAGGDNRLVLISIDTASETLTLGAVSEISVEGLASAIPASEPSYAFFGWLHTHTSPPRREIVFIYSCPSNSPIKHRMVYSSGASSVFQHAKFILSSSESVLASRKIETSNPAELNDVFLKTELGIVERTPGSGSGTPGEGIDEKKPFSRPKGPAKRR